MNIRLTFFIPLFAFFFPFFSFAQEAPALYGIEFNTKNPENVSFEPGGVQILGDSIDPLAARYLPLSSERLLNISFGITHGDAPVVLGEDGSDTALYPTAKLFFLNDDNSGEDPRDYIDLDDGKILGSSNPTDFWNGTIMGFTLCNDHAASGAITNEPCIIGGSASAVEQIEATQSEVSFFHISNPDGLPVTSPYSYWNLLFGMPMSSILPSPTLKGALVLIPSDDPDDFDPDTMILPFNIVTGEGSLFSVSFPGAEATQDEEDELKTSIHLEADASLVFKVRAKKTNPTSLGTLQRAEIAFFDTFVGSGYIDENDVFHPDSDVGFNGASLYFCDAVLLASEPDCIYGNTEENRAAAKAAMNHNGVSVALAEDGEYAEWTLSYGDEMTQEILDTGTLPRVLYILHYANSLGPYFFPSQQDDLFDPANATTFSYSFTHTSSEGEGDPGDNPDTGGNESGDSSRSSSRAGGIRYCTDEITTFCMPRGEGALGIPQNILESLYRELLGLYEELLALLTEGL